MSTVWVLGFSLAVWGLSESVRAQESAVADLAFNAEDLDFILKQIEFAERHAAGEELLDILPNASIPWGLRTVDGSFNNLIPGQENFGQADQEFPEGVERSYPDAQILTFPLAPDDVVGIQTSYQQGSSSSAGVGARTVQDSTPRLISHLIVNQSVDNPAAVYAAAQNEFSSNDGPDITGVDQFLIPNIAPDAGLSAPFNAFTTFFGQFFDHGLDLINKGGNGLVFMPLQPDDPLYVEGSPTNFMVMTRASLDAGPDGLIGTEDDVADPINATTPHVDQQQTYASHPSAHVLLRHYEVRGGTLQASGRLLNGFGTDGLLDTADDGGMATWDTVQAQALEKFGIILDDFDGANVPLIVADLYGKFIPGPDRGLPQLVTLSGPIEGDLAAPVDATQAIRVNHSFFLDVAHTANPGGLVPDPDNVINARTDLLSGQVTRGIRAAGPAGTYDDELLGVHFTCGDGRCNENIALTTIHSIFHREHNRLIDVTKRVLLDAGDLAALNEWLDTPAAVFPAWGGLSFLVSDASLAHQAETRTALDSLDLDWNGERVFQAARFGTEMQYNRIVFDEFAPTLALLKDDFEQSGDTGIDASITAEFSQSVYRFGHSMLTSTVDRYDSDFNTIVDNVSGDPAQLGLFEAFLNPLALYNADADGVAQLNPEEAAGAVIRGITRTAGNEIDEFVTGALQNNLVGLPLDLGAINIARGRDVGNPTLNDARRMFHADTGGDSKLTPYAHWVDYADNLRHEPSLVNFVAAYGTHPSLAGADGIVGNADDPDPTYAGRRAAACAIVGALADDAAAYCIDHGFAVTPAATPADAMDFLFSTGAWASDADGRTITGMDDVDFWNGGLAEERMPFGSYLGSTHNYVFETQIENLQNGDRFYYVGRTATIHLFSELESNTFTALIMRNTDLGEVGGGALSLNIFLTQDVILEVDQSQQFDADGIASTGDPDGDAELIDLVIRDADLSTTNIHIADRTRFVQLTGALHATIAGTEGDDTIVGGIDDDTIYGRGGNDRIEGGDGPDLIEGGSGDDIITDLGGADVIEGGSGNDAINSGNEFDVIFGDAGNDFIVNPSEFGEIFGGEGDDYIFDGFHLGHVRGGAGHDWMENLGGGEDLMQGDNGAAAEAGEPAIKGNDVAIAYGGNNDFDMENGDDIVVDGPGIERAEGQLGFDWISFANDNFGVSVDLDLTVFLRPILPPSNDSVSNRYDRVEGLSGSSHGDILHGTPNRTGLDQGNELTNFDLIEGLSDLVPLSERRDLLPDVITGEPQFGFTNGEIIIGGAGSDLMAGEGGDDILDGDASLKVAIRTPNPELRTGALGQALLAAKAIANTTTSQAIADATAAAMGDVARAAAADAVVAADASLAAAIAAAEAADAAAAAAADAVANPGGVLTVTDALGNLIEAAVTGTGSLETEWDSFLASCNAALLDLGLDLEASTAETAAQAAAVQAEATAAVADAAQAEVDAAQVNLDAVALLSAAASVTAQNDLVTAQAALDAVDEMVLVPGMEHLFDAVFGGFINPGELSISRVISDDDPTDANTDIAVFQGNLTDYTIDLSRTDGFIVVTDNRVLPVNQDPIKPGNEGRDLVRNVERLQFSDQTLVLDIVAPINSVAVGQPTVSGIPEAGMILTASIAGVTDADNVTPENPTGAVTGKVDWIWQSELNPGDNNFTPILRVGSAGDSFELHGTSIVLSVEEVGRLVRVVGVFQDDDLVFETVTSTPVLVDESVLCGDGVLDPATEECDDGNNVDGDGCSAICTIEPPPDPLCGDGVINPLTEECDDGNNVDGDGCSAVCTIEGPAPVCGDGILDLATEECDDGNNVDGDGCSAICTIEAGPVCGDGVLDVGEECDDGNNVDGDGCSAICAIEPDPNAVVTIDRVRLGNNGRLRVDGSVAPLGSSASLFLGPADVTGSICTGQFIAALAVDPATGAFAFDSGNGAFPVDPGEVCVSSDNGRAVSAGT